MSRALVTLWRREDRERAHRWIDGVPNGTRVEFKEAKRSTDQNSRMWLILTNVASALLWHGQRYAPEDWKDYFMHAYRGHRWMPAEEGGMVPIGRSTSDLSKEEHGELMELMEAFCARNGVALPWDKEAA